MFKTVELGKADAGATLDADLALDPKAASQFRTILKTEPMAPHPLAAHPRVPAAVREAVIRAVVRIGRESGGAELLSSVRLADPLRADYDRDYRRFESMDIRALTQWGR